MSINTVDLALDVRRLALDVRYWSHCNAIMSSNMRVAMSNFATDLSNDTGYLSNALSIATAASNAAASASNLIQSIAGYSTSNSLAWTSNAAVAASNAAMSASNAIGALSAFGSGSGVLSALCNAVEAASAANLTSVVAYDAAVFASNLTAAPISNIQADRWITSTVDGSDRMRFDVDGPTRFRAPVAGRFVLESTAGAMVAHFSPTSNALPGTIYCSNVVSSGTVSSVSDARAKFDVRPIQGALAKVKSLAGYTYAPSQGSDRRCIGLIAQEVRASVPEAVQEGEDGMLSVAYGNLVGLLVSAINELDAKVAGLQGST